MDDHPYTSTTADLLDVTDGDDYGQSDTPFIVPWPFQLAYTSAFVVMVTVAIAGNLIVVWVVTAQKHMRTVTNYFLANLAVASALLSILSTPFTYFHCLHNHWPFGRAYCKFEQFILPCTVSASVSTFIAIAIDRYRAIIQPQKPRMGAGLVLTVIVVIWIVSAAFAVPNLIYADVDSWTHGNGETRTVCYLKWSNGGHDLAYNVSNVFFDYIAPLVALLIVYAVIGKKLWGSRAIDEQTAGQEETIRSKRQVVRMMIVIVVVFAVCWLPLHISHFLFYYYIYSIDGMIIRNVYLIIYWVAMSNAMYNPIIYCWMDASFRNSFKYVFRWLPCITWHPNDALSLSGGCDENVQLGPTTTGGSHTFPIASSRSQGPPTASDGQLV